jgi:hypothetical protein
VENENPGTDHETGLAEELGSYIQYERASTGQRFLNFLIDNLLMRFGLSYLTGTAVGFSWELSFQIMHQNFVYDRTTLDFIITFVTWWECEMNYLDFYYTFCEKGPSKAYTLGKLLTGTRAC